MAPAPSRALTLAVLGVAALLAVVVLVQVPLAYAAGPALALDPTGAGADGAARAYLLMRLPVLGAMVLALAVTSGWLWRARARSEQLMPGYPHRHGRVWTVLGWLVPVLSLWWPRRVVTDVWRAGSLAHHGHDAPPFARWWRAWVGWYVLDNLATLMLWRADRVGSWLAQLGTVHLVSAICLLVALAAWVRIVTGVAAVLVEPASGAAEAAD